MYGTRNIGKVKVLSIKKKSKLREMFAVEYRNTKMVLEHKGKQYSIKFRIDDADDFESIMQRVAYKLRDELQREKSEDVWNQIKELEGQEIDL